MKKTLFSLLACATLVAPAMADDFSNSFTLSVDAQDAKKIVATQTAVEDKDITINSITSSMNMTNEDYDGYLVQEGSNNQSWYFTFTFKNSTEKTMTISALTFDVEVFKGGFQSPDSENDYFTLYTADGKWTSYDSIGLAPKDGSTEFTANTNPNIVLDANEECSLIFYHVGASVNKGGVKSVKVSGTLTPEPATATLSLLALAGLAVRRRRH